MQLSLVVQSSSLLCPSFGYLCVCFPTREPSSGWIDRLVIGWKTRSYWIKKMVWLQKLRRASTRSSTRSVGTNKSSRSNTKRANSALGISKLDSFNGSTNSIPNQTAYNAYTGYDDHLCTQVYYYQNRSHIMSFSFANCRLLIPIFFFGCASIDDLLNFFKIYFYWFIDTDERTSYVGF